MYIKKLRVRSLNQPNFPFYHSVSFNNAGTDYLFMIKRAPMTKQISFYFPNPQMFSDTNIQEILIALIKHFNTYHAPGGSYAN